MAIMIHSDIPFVHLLMYEWGVFMSILNESLSINASINERKSLV